MTYFGLQATLAILRTLRAQSPFRWNRGFHMAAVGRVGAGQVIITILNVKRATPDGVALFTFRSLAMTYSHMGKPHTTIGDASFHY